MKCLAAVANACKDKRGGALASCVHGFLQHGDPVIRETVKNLLGAVSSFAHIGNFTLTLF
jgi:gamma-tubulin complex component 3